MKTSFYFSWLLLCGSLSLYGMEAEEGYSQFPFDTLPAEMQERVLEYAHGPVDIKDGIQDVAEWAHPGVVEVKWSPSGAYIESDSASFSSIQIRTFAGKKCMTFESDEAYKLAGQVAWAPNERLFAISVWPADHYGSEKNTTKIYDITGNKRCDWCYKGVDSDVTWLSDDKLVSAGMKEVQVRTSEGLLCGRWKPGKRKLLFWAPGKAFVAATHFPNDPEDDQEVHIYSSTGEKCAAWQLTKNNCWKRPMLIWSLDGRFIFTVSPENISQIHTPQGEKYAEWRRADGDVVSWSADSTRLVRWSSNRGKKVQLCTDKGVPYAEWEHESKVRTASWVQGDRIETTDSNRVQIHTCEGDKDADESPCGRMVLTCADSDKVGIFTDDLKSLAEYVHPNVRYLSCSPNGYHIASSSPAGSVMIKDISRLLLANHKLSHPTMNQHFLLKKLQHGLLKENKPVELNELGRDTLRGMPEIEKLLRVEKREKAQYWRVMLKNAAAKDLEKTEGEAPSHLESLQ